MIIPEDKIGLVVSLFNSNHNGLKCTVEKEASNSIDFLYLELTIYENNIIKTNWFRIQTYSGTYLNYDYFNYDYFNYSIEHKIGIVRNIVDSVILLADLSIDLLTFKLN